MAQPLRYGEPDWDSQPHSNPINFDIMQRPRSNKSYEELRFDRLVASGSVNNSASHINSFRRQVTTSGFRNQDILTIMVSEKAKLATFKIHERILSSSSKFVEAAMRNQFIEKYSRVVCLPAEDPDIFDLYAQWLYNGLLNVSNNDLLLKMYKLGERLIDDKFQESCLKALKGSFSPFTVDQILFVLNNLLDHDQLRRYCISELGKGIISGKYNFNEGQLDALHDHMLELMQAVMSTVSMKRGFSPRPAETEASEQTSAASASSQPQGIQPSHYTPNIGWHYAGPSNGPSSTTASLFGPPRTSNIPNASHATTSLFRSGPTSSSSLFGGNASASQPLIQPHMSTAPAATQATLGSRLPHSSTLFGTGLPMLSTLAQQSVANAPAPTQTALGRGATSELAFGSATSLGPSASQPSNVPNAASNVPLTNKWSPQTTSLFSGMNGMTPAANLAGPASSGLFARQPPIAATNPPQKSYSLPCRSDQPGQDVAGVSQPHSSTLDMQKSSKPFPSTSQRSEGSAKVFSANSGTAPIRRPSRTPLELWLGEDFPAKVSKPSAVRQGSLVVPDNAKAPLSNAFSSKGLDTSLQHTQLSSVTNGSVDKGKGREIPPDWSEEASENNGEDIIYTPASSTASDQPRTTPPAERFEPYPNENLALSDYQLQLALLEQQNRSRLALARQDSESKGQSDQAGAKSDQVQTAATKVASLSSSTKPYDWSSNAVYMSIKDGQGPAGFEKYAHTAQSGFAQVADRTASSANCAETSFGDGGSFPQKSGMFGSTGVYVPPRPQFGVPTPLPPATALSAAHRMAALQREAASRQANVKQ